MAAQNILYVPVMLEKARDLIDGPKVEPYYKVGARAIDATLNEHGYVLARGRIDNFSIFK